MFQFKQRECVILSKNVKYKIMNFIATYVMILILKRDILEN